MRKNNVRNIIIHTENNKENKIAGKVNQFHVDMIKRRLDQFNLSVKQKIEVIDYIIADLKSREINGIIK